MMVRKKRSARVRNQGKSTKHLLIIATVLFVGTIITYKLLPVHFFDSSLNGSEVKEVKQNAVPKDVKKEVEKQRQINQISTPPSYRVPILMYHYIEFVKDPNDKVRASLTTSPLTLSAEIKTLQDAGFTFLTNAELAAILDNKKHLPEKPVVLTFDDGYQDFYTNAYPILKKYHVKSTQYVIAGFLDHYNHLTTSELIEIAKDGLVEIGAHTMTHAWLKGRGVGEVGWQISQSKELLEKKIGRDVVSFAYPYGAFDLQATQIVEATGFKSAASTVPGINQSQENRFFLYRLRPGGRIGPAFLNWLNQTKFSAF